MVAIMDIDEARGVAVAREVRDQGGESVACAGDVRAAADCQRAVEMVVDRWDIGVNNAGICRWGDGESHSESDWDEVVDTNLKGVFLCCQAEARSMIPRRYGKIINIASMSGHIVNRPQNQAAYNASKAGVIHLTRTLAAEWGPCGIRVNGISPGYIRTPLVESEAVRHLAQQWAEWTPLGRLGEVADQTGRRRPLA
ncbi:MAG: SDR family oxidoreductase [Firmicutes bacterium]|nr:SDR family oxidoreductase [Bacillota bacterium]